MNVAERLGAVPRPLPHELPPRIRQTVGADTYIGRHRLHSLDEELANGTGMALCERSYSQVLVSACLIGESVR